MKLSRERLQGVPAFGRKVNRWMKHEVTTVHCVPDGPGSSRTGDVRTDTGADPTSLTGSYLTWPGGLRIGAGAMR